jgi:hypothetical protein
MEQPKIFVIIYLKYIYFFPDEKIDLSYVVAALHWKDALKNPAMPKSKIDS